MGKKYRVKVIMISLKRNQVAETGAIVDESQLATDAKTLVDGGYIELVEAKKDESSDSNEPKKLTEMTVAELKNYATEKKLEVNLNQNKANILADILEIEKPE